jgi:glycosyltransferase involved in cell wall biosynthesis
VLLEAMQFQLPVVATRWRGIPSIVEDQVSGFLVPIKDSDALAEKLKLLILNPALRNQMGAAGRRKYCQDFTAQRHHQQMERMFMDLFVDA